MNIKVKIENQTYDVNVGDLNARPVIATIDGQVFEVWPEEAPRMVAAPVAVQTAAVPAPVATPAPAPVTAAVAKPAAAPASGAAGGVVTAPIPGVIVALSVKEGDAVKKGQELCVLEAMKMKNSIRSSQDGVIGEVKVKIGDHVQHGQSLIAYKS